MRKNLTEIVFILDRSGSMNGLERDTIGGFNSMIEQQKKTEGEALISTVLFDNVSEVLHDRVDVKDIRPMTDRDYTVRGCTALLDAIGGAIHHIGNIHKYARPEDVPEHTMFVITTDGMENASRRYNSEKVKQMIERQKAKYGWEFLFLGANIDAVETASQFGIGADRAVNYQCDSEGTALNYEVVSEAISSVRCSAPLNADWKKRIDEDYKKRGGKYTYVSKGKFELREKPKPTLMQERDAIVKVTLASICSSDLHIKHGSVPRAVPGITVGHEMVGIVEEVGKAVTRVKPGDRVTVNVETFCGECFFCKKGYVNNCTDENGGWALGCRIDGGQAEYVRVPFADQGLNKIPDGVTDRQALLVGDVLATGYWAARISEISEQDTVLIIGAGPTGICTLLSVMLKKPRRIIVCEKDKNRLQFIRQHYPEILLVSPEKCEAFVRANSDHGGADVVLEVAGAEATFRLAWECARPNGLVTVVALYDQAQILPLPDMYGKNLTFKTGGVDGCDCEETLRLIAEGKLNTEPLITHTYPLERIEEAYELFEGKRDGVIKVAVEC